ncbi:hypothetical protein DLM75_04070 [Leptospira stimsonii]|uniref:Uncharacterized protein n=1 Tax=Leptospira stimsonii TaxID=2202203 RepID=A0A396ZFW0_9LEPT|nr:hypothetical protein [Leptospira stimsonii]RHX92378.1 hypothetical protein DLM75_04070 [Leptospira stimsonii]
MAKKDLLKQAAGAHVRKTLGGENPAEETASPEATPIVREKSVPVDSSQNVHPTSPEVRMEQTSSSPDQQKTENLSVQNSSSSEAREEKHLPKKNHLHRISSVMRLEDYTRPESAEREGSSRFLKIAGVILLALAIWFFWPAKHEIYMDIDKMTPEKVSSMSPQKEYHFSHGQDFFIYYKKGWSTPKRVRLSIYKTDGGKEEFSVQEKDFRKSFEKFQTYYDDTFFDQQGSYEVEIRDEDGELLVNKKFTID